MWPLLPHPAGRVVPRCWFHVASKGNQDTWASPAALPLLHLPFSLAACMLQGRNAQLMGRGMDTAEKSRSWREGEILLQVARQIPCLKSLPHFAFPCQSSKGSIAQEPRHRQGWSWQHKAVAQEEGEPHIHPHPSQLCPVKPETLPRGQAAGEESSTGELPVKLRAGTKPSAATGMLQDTALAPRIHLLPNPERTSLSLGTFRIARFIMGWRVLMKPGLVRRRQLFGACSVSGNVDVCLLQCKEMSECRERRVTNLL